MRPRFLVALISLALATGQIARAESLDDSINYLLDYIANSHATFIRNGQTHTTQEAVGHIKAKYEHFKNEIKTPEDFIRLSASKSLLTGQPYRVRTADGKRRSHQVSAQEVAGMYMSNPLDQVAGFFAPQL